MTTSTFATPIDHSGNAGFQAWATELIVKLLAVNPTQLTQTADTGQLANPVVAARPGTNTIAGYWILKWDDGVTTPLYIKIEVGTGGTAGTAAIFYTVGSGSNGSGTLTGALSTRTNFTVNTVASSTTVNFSTYLCCATGAFSLGWKMGGVSGTSAGIGAFAIARSIDDSGVVNNDGYLTVSFNNGPSAFIAQSVNLANNVAFSNTATTFAACFFTLVPMGITSSLVSGNAQYFRTFAAYPLARPIGHLVIVISAEIAQGTSFSGESGSITDHTFLSLGNGGHIGSYCMAILWQ